MKITGIFNLLTEEQKKAALAYRGPENHGDERFTRDVERDKKTSNDLNSDESENHDEQLQKPYARK